MILKNEKEEDSNLRLFVGEECVRRISKREALVSRFSLSFSFSLDKRAASGIKRVTAVSKRGPDSGIFYRRQKRASYESRPAAQVARS